VTYDAAKGYIGSAPELRQPIVALSLGGLRRKVEIALLPDDVIPVLHLDRSARIERDRSDEQIFGVNGQVLGRIRATNGRL
jgi:hypothetical protein